AGNAGYPLRLGTGMVSNTMNGSKPGRTKAELEARRRLAVQRVTDGWSQKDVAAFLGVHPVTVAKWVAAFRGRRGRRAGRQADPRAAPAPGCRPGGPGPHLADREADRVRVPHRPVDGRPGRPPNP